MNWLKSPIFWLVFVGIVFLLFVPSLAQILDDDLYEELMGEKKKKQESCVGEETHPTLGYRYITQHKD
ncbi:uncharacterized protein Gasu_44340 [Galdieria sulphuraria]|uniref:Uncharacterized protein n=1 Tax=Galdieria sulphuraria TaxID=130081 RepID=M2WVT4_GALSU|nr:uncharacterized protein Gasu_44340 [Galdieria sulphuraria]EME28100.1 hypothetical protein Gasu_44340 [Galdieria sulphuraria]|eukprot:XP_005704620.1 hypothetical protein Gasu_44340 [Galdieria sulphuraria]